MYYTELEFINLLVNGIDTGNDFAITNHDLSDFFNSKREDVPKEYKYIERELLSIKEIYKETIMLCRHSYYLYIAAILTSIKNEGLEASSELFEYINKHYCLFPTIAHLSNILIMLYLPKRMDYVLMERDNRKISIARLYHRIGYNVYYVNLEGIYNEHEKDFFELIKGYECVGPFYVRSMMIGYYYVNHDLYNISLDTLKNCLDNINEFVEKMKLNDLNYENIDENTILNCFQDSLNKIIIK